MAGRITPDGSDEGRNRADVGNGGDGPEGDRRRSARFACGGEAKLSHLPSDGIFVPGKILDLSLHGCRVDTKLPIDPSVLSEIVLRVNSTSFRAVGAVRALRGQSGAGIEFVQLSRSGKDMLEELIRELARLQSAMNKLTAVRPDIKASSFEKQMERGKSEARKLGERLDSLQKVFSVKGAESESDSAQSISAEENQKSETQPLVITINLFG